MLQWQGGQLVTVWPEEFTTNRAKWIPLGAWDQSVGNMPTMT
jgi:hypothetical protein